MFFHREYTSAANNYVRMITKCIAVVIQSDCVVFCVSLYLRSKRLNITDWYQCRNGSRLTKNGISALRAPTWGFCGFCLGLSFYLKQLMQFN